MHEPLTIQAYHSLGDDYSRAFQTFLAHTDQKVRAREWLTAFVARLPARRVLLDVGAGNGTVTAWLVPSFGRTLAIEPNPSLRADLARHCPGVEVLADPMNVARPSSPADLVLCSHVFYYVPVEDWPATLERLVSWLAPGGVAVVVLQHHESDGMRMVEHFLDREFPLLALGERFEQEKGASYEVRADVVPAYVTAPDLTTACTIAEFVLNTVPMASPPRRQALEDYVRAHFTFPGVGYRFSCTQAFLQLRRQSSHHAPRDGGQASRGA